MKIAVVGIAGQSVSLKVNAFHTGGETVLADDIHFEIGGKGFNQAVAAKRFGADTSFISAVGADGFIDKVKNFLKKEGITAVLPQKMGNTAYAAILTDPTGHNRVTCFAGAALEPLDIQTLFASELQYADVLLLNNEVPENVNIAAAKIAKSYGVKVILNPAPSKPLSDEFIGLIDMATPNEHEQQGLDRIPEVVVTLGERGCLIKNKDQIVPAFKVKAVDTTGAGDTFNGVFAVMIAMGKSLKDACQYANAAASLSVTKPYVNAAIPTQKETKQFIKTIVRQRV